MPRILPGNPGVLFEVGLSSRLPPRAWFRSPPPRDVDVGNLLRASYGSLSGRTLVAIGLLLGIPLFVIGILVTGTVTEHVVIAAAGLLFAAFFVIVPAIPAVRFARALRLGVIDHATVTREPTPNATRGGLRIRDQGGNDVPFDAALMWSQRLRAGMDIELLVDPARGRVLWILGPAGDDESIPDDSFGSRTMPGR